MRFHPAAQGDWPNVPGEEALESPHICIPSLSRLPFPDHFDSQVERGRLEVFNCTIVGKAWLDHNRPQDLRVEPPSLAAQLL
jgi:hypothetical protein